VNFLHYEVTTQTGDAIMVSLSGNAANVLVMDDNDFRSYRSGRGGRIRYFGGYYNQSPAVVRPPSAGHWNVVIDLGGRAGKVEASVRVIH
jgi:hypothetical protein